MEKTRTQIALDLIAQGYTVRAAAKEAGVSEAAVHARRKVLREKATRDTGLCQCCGAPVGPDGKFNR